jgi:hypothetical protein
MDPWNNYIKARRNIDVVVVYYNRDLPASELRLGKLTQSHTRGLGYIYILRHDSVCAVHIPYRSP